MNIESFPPPEKLGWALGNLLRFIIDGEEKTEPVPQYLGITEKLCDVIIKVSDLSESNIDLDPKKELRILELLNEVLNELG